MTLLYLKNSIAKQLSIQAIIGYVSGYAILCVFLIPLLISGEYIWYRWIQSDYANVQYFSVEPQKDAFVKGEMLGFVTDRVVHKSMPLAFNDRVFCFDSRLNDWVIAMGYASENQKLELSERKPTPWNYPYTAPEWATVCHNVSQVTERRPYGITVQWEYQSRDFMVNQ